MADCKQLWHNADEVIYPNVGLKETGLVDFSCTYGFCRRIRNSLYPVWPYRNMKKKHFEWFLSEIDTFKNPKVELEQYSTSAELAGVSYFIVC